MVFLRSMALAVSRIYIFHQRHPLEDLQQKKNAKCKTENANKQKKDDLEKIIIYEPTIELYSEINTLLQMIDVFFRLIK